MCMVSLLSLVLSLARALRSSVLRRVDKSRLPMRILHVSLPIRKRSVARAFACMYIAGCGYFRPAERCCASTTSTASPREFVIAAVIFVCPSGLRDGQLAGLSVRSASASSRRPVHLEANLIFERRNLVLHGVR